MKPEKWLQGSKLACDHIEIGEFEINPLIVYEEGRGILALDMKLTLKKVRTFFF